MIIIVLACVLNGVQTTITEHFARAASSTSSWAESALTIPYPYSQGVLYFYFLKQSPLTDHIVSSLSPSPLLLSSHFFAVILYAIWVVFAHPRAGSSMSANPADVKRVYGAPSAEEYPQLTLKGIRMVRPLISYFSTLRY